MSDMKKLDELRAEYHRGYVDAMHARATETWQLDRERMEIVRGLREFRCADIEPWFEMQFWTLLRLLGVESDASTPADCDDVAHLRDRLIHLLGGDSNSPNTVSEDAEFAEHSDDREKVVRKLQALQFDGGSHENLSKIAYAIYPCATGWTCESAKGLRDKLIELMGGSDGSVHVGGLRCVGGCMGDVSNGGDTGRTHDSPSNRDGNHMGVREGVGRDDGGHCESICQHCDACSDVRAGGVGEQATTITSELRKWVKSLYTPNSDELKLEGLRIADRIYAEHKAACNRLKVERDTAEIERDALQEHCRNQQKQLAEFNRVLNTWHWDSENYKQWCPMSLDRAVRKAEEKWESACGRIGELKDERDDLKMRLREFADDQERERKYHQQRIKKLVKERDAALRGQSPDEYRTAYDELENQRDHLLHEIARLSADRDRYKAACEAAQSLNRDMMDGISQLRSSLSSVLDALDGGDAR